MVFFFIETLIILLVKVLKKNFKWILSTEDELPKFEKKKLKLFYKKSFDRLLGWDRKKNTSGKEISNKTTSFQISKFGYRGNKKFKKNCIPVFGDSFAFCRYVNDEETWEEYLEKKLNVKIFNYGVGNYGLDQSFLKYIRYEKKFSNKIVIFNVVPETIARIHSIWKHYREFGNIYAFKPIFDFDHHDIKLIKIKINTSFSEKKIHNEIKKIKKNDIFYEKKFRKNIFLFPYTLCFLRNFSLYSIIFYNLLLFKIYNIKQYYNNANSAVIKKNIIESHLMYRNDFFVNALKKLLLKMNKMISKKNKKMVLIISPQLLDLESKTNKNFINFYKNLSKNINCLDLTTELKNNLNYKKFYYKDIYGGHFNQLGNKYISRKIEHYLKKNKLI